MKCKIWNVYPLGICGFLTDFDDGSKLFIDNQIIRVEYFEKNESNEIHVKWMKYDTKWAEIDSKDVFYRNVS